MHIFLKLTTCLFVVVFICSCSTTNSVKVIDSNKEKPPSLSDAPEQMAKKVELHVDLLGDASKKTAILETRGVFGIQQGDHFDNNLQVMGRKGHIIVLAAIDHVSDNADVYWVKINLLDTEQIQIAQGVLAQIGFASPEAKESDPVIINANSVFLFKEHPSDQKIKNESNSLVIRIVLLR